MVILWQSFFASHLSRIFFRSWERLQHQQHSIERISAKYLCWFDKAQYFAESLLVPWMGVFGQACWLSCGHMFAASWAYGNFDVLGEQAPAFVSTPYRIRCIITVYVRSACGKLCVGVALSEAASKKYPCSRRTTRVWTDRALILQACRCFRHFIRRLTAPFLLSLYEYVCECVTMRLGSRAKSAILNEN